MDDLSIQLYSLRSDKDFEGSFEKLAKIGYTGVEFAGYHNLDAQEMKKLLDNNGLKAVGTHIGVDKMLNEPEKEIEYNLAVGNKNLIVPYCPIKSKDDTLKLAEDFNKFGEICKKYGAVFGYHNHAHEFALDNGEYLFDILMDNTSPDLVKAEIDVFWVAYAGLDVLETLKKYKSRLPLIHLKELENMETRANVSLGKGIIDFKAIKEQYSDATFIVEQEQIEEGVDIWESIKIGCDYWNSL